MRVGVEKEVEREDALELSDVGKFKEPEFDVSSSSSLSICDSTTGWE